MGFACSPLLDKDIHGCRACKYCYFYEGECIQRDDITPIIDKMREIDMLVLATPIYYYSLPSQTKAVLDRMYAWHRKPLAIKKSVLLGSLEDSADRINLLTAQYKTAASYMGWRGMGGVYAHMGCGAIPSRRTIRH